jgi:hypothetical protein
MRNIRFHHLSSFSQSVRIVTSCSGEVTAEPYRVILFLSFCWHTMMHVHVLTEGDDVRAISWNSNFLGYDFYHLMTIAANRLVPQYCRLCVPSGCLQMSMDIWMVLKQLGQEHDLFVIYLKLLQCFCHSFPSHWKNFPVLYFQTLSHIALSLWTQHARKSDDSWTIPPTAQGVSMLQPVFYSVTVLASVSESAKFF